MKLSKHIEGRRVTCGDYTRHRDAYIIEKCLGKKVLHIGAADWPYTEEKLKNDTLLYAKIDKVASRQLGVDIDKDSIEYLSKQDFKKSDIAYKDMDYLDEIDFEPDVIVFGETLEHLMNLKTALDSLKRVMKKDTELIISVPNALNIVQVPLTFAGLEFQHPDHKVAFTYKTVTQLLQASDFKINEIKFTWLVGEFRKLNWKGKSVYAIPLIVSRVFPMFAGNILLSVKLSG